jgi:hypothetical protein
MYVVICKRVVKMNTHATEKFAARSANETRLYVSGPFVSLKTAQRAALAALATHTCLDAQVWSGEQVRDTHARGYSGNGAEKHDALREALRLVSVS